MCERRKRAQSSGNGGVNGVGSRNSVGSS